jgi:hypothetical protein
MDFTREPIIETVITPKEGWKLVLRNSKGGSTEEYFVDAVEVVTFGHSQFYRTLERPKAFLLPVTDFEVLEVREARMVLKNVGVDRNIKIGGGRDAMKTSKEPEEKYVEGQEKGEGKGRGRRRLSRRRRGKESTEGEPATPAEPQAAVATTEGEHEIPPPRLIAPPTALISETLSRYREDDTYAAAFYSRDESPEEEVMPFISDEEFDEGDNLLFSEEKKPKASKTSKKETSSKAEDKPVKKTTASENEAPQEDSISEEEAAVKEETEGK